MDLYGIFSDLHLPFGDERAIKLALDVFEDVKVTHIIINGDMLDFINVSAHSKKDPEIRTTLDDEIHAGRTFLANLRKRFKGVEIIYIFGNHEHRLDRFIIENCPHFWNMLKLENMLGLEGLDIKFIPYNERYQLGEANLYVQHSPPSYSANSAAATSMAKKVDENHIWSCVHRTDMSVKTGASGKVYASFTLGWFGETGIVDVLKKRENRKVFSYTKNHESWNRSFCLATVDGKNHHVNQVLIKDYSCMVGNSLYLG